MDNSKQKTAVLLRAVEGTDPRDNAVTVQPGVYQILHEPGDLPAGSISIWSNPDRLDVAIIPNDGARVRIADGTVPFVIPEIGHRPGMVVGTCGHAVAGSEWLAGMRKCEYCSTTATCDHCGAAVHRDVNGWWVGDDDTSDCPASERGHEASGAAR